MNYTLKRLRQEGYVESLEYYTRGSRGFAYVHGLTDRALKECALPPLAKTFDEHSFRTLDHELEISFFHIALKHWTEVNGFKLYWQQRDLKRGKVHPDALFTLTGPKGTFCFFLEIERAKLSGYEDGQPSIVTKLDNYADLFDTDKCRTAWDFRKFRVVIVQRTDERRAFLLRTLQAKHARRMFWLTTEIAYKQDAGADIFLTPKDFPKMRYSFTSL